MATSKPPGPVRPHRPASRADTDRSPSGAVGGPATGLDWLAVLHERQAGETGIKGRDATLDRLRRELEQGGRRNEERAPDPTTDRRPSGKASAPRFSRTVAAAALASERSSGATWDRMPLSEGERPRGRGWQRWRRVVGLQPAAQPARGVPSADRPAFSLDRRAPDAPADLSLIEGPAPGGRGGGTGVPPDGGEDAALHGTALSAMVVTILRPSILRLRRHRRIRGLIAGSRERQPPALPSPKPVLALPPPGEARLPIPSFVQGGIRLPALMVSPSGQAAQGEQAARSERATRRARRPQPTAGGRRRRLPGVLILAGLLMVAGVPWALNPHHVQRLTAPATGERGETTSGTAMAPAEPGPTVAAPDDPVRPPLPDARPASGPAPSPSEPPARVAAAPPAAGPTVEDPPAEPATSWENLYDLGHTLLAADDLKGALVALEGAAALNPDHPAIRYDLGWTLQRAGRAEEAIVHYRRALELEPNHAFAHHNLGNLLKERRQDREAAALLARAVVLLPGNARAAFDYASLLESWGALHAAADMYRRAGRNASGSDIAGEARRRLQRIETVIEERQRS